jgi:hypothetical protein
VRDYVAGVVEASSATYFVCDFAFGSMSHSEALQSAALFAKEVMPGFAE